MPTLTLQEFTTAAMNSMETGGIMKIEEGHLKVEGTFASRNRVFSFKNPDQASENMQILKEFEKVIRRELPIPAEEKFAFVLDDPANPINLAERIFDIAHDAMDKYGDTTRVKERFSDLSPAETILGATATSSVQHGDLAQAAAYSSRPSSPTGTAESMRVYTLQKTLDGEIHEARRLNYALDVFKAVGLKTEEIGKDYKFVVGQYNKAMCDLHNRFPRLREVEPPVISHYINAPTEKGIHPFTKDNSVAYYNRDSRTLYFSDFTESQWEESVRLGINSGFYAPKIVGFQGVIHHEYAPHLSLTEVPLRQWFPKLVTGLKRNGIFPKDGTVSRVGGGHNYDFDAETKKNIGKSVGGYAAVSASEFTAELLAWYMSPGYGESEVATPPTDGHGEAGMVLKGEPYAENARIS